MIELTEQDILDITSEKCDTELAALCEAVGPKAVLEIIRMFGGSTINIPLLDSVYKHKRNELIRHDHIHLQLTMNQLAIKYGLSSRQVYAIVSGK